MKPMIREVPAFQEALAESLQRGQQGALRTLRQTLIRQ